MKTAKEGGVQRAPGSRDAWVSGLGAQGLGYHGTRFSCKLSQNPGHETLKPRNRNTQTRTPLNPAHPTVEAQKLETQ